MNAFLVSVYSRLRLWIRPLNPALQKSHRLRRLASWIDVKLLGKRLRRVQTRAGFGLWVNPKDHAVARHLLAYGTWQPAEAGLIQTLLRVGDTTVDVGANIGYMTGLMASAVGQNGHVISLEPEASNFAILQKNVEENGWSNVTCLPFGASSSASSGTLYIDDNNLGNHSLAVDSDRQSAQSQVRLIRVDSLFREMTDDVRLVKIDVQGWEAEVLRGMEGLRGRLDFILLEFFPDALNAANESPSAFLDELYGWGRVSLFHQGSATEILSSGQLLDFCKEEGQADLLVSCRDGDA